jgi:hypothetical protein
MQSRILEEFEKKALHIARNTCIKRKDGWSLKRSGVIELEALINEYSEKWGKEIR